MDKFLFIVFLSLMLFGCGYGSHADAYITGTSKQCVDGVEYLQFSSGVSVAYTPSGKIKSCAMNY